MKLELYYATNRGHIGRNRWKPDAYGTDFSSDGMENLRFGKVTVEASKNTVGRHLRRKTGGDNGDGNELEDYLTGRSKRSSEIEAFEEKLERGKSDVGQPKARFGSSRLYEELRKLMNSDCDVLVYIHGFNVDWNAAVGSALALQCMLNRSGVASVDKEVRVILFTWPSNGRALPFVSYKSDRSEARGSGYAFGRGLLKLRDHLRTLGRQDCGQVMHLLCHSMGNYVLQSAVGRLGEHNPGSTLPRMFEHVFMCAPDVDEGVLEADGAMSMLHELCNSVSVYHNRGDVAMYVSDYTKGNPDRLGHNGSAVPGAVHHKIQQIDCSPLVTGLVEHSYYQWGPVNRDIRQSIDGIPHQDPARRRVKRGIHDNAWVLPGAAMGAAPAQRSAADRR